jgi:hypothetical protein
MPRARLIPLRGLRQSLIIVTGFAGTSSRAGSAYR